MILTRIGKCVECDKPTKESKDFPENLRIGDRPSGIPKEVMVPASVWRQTPLKCDNHRK